MDLQVILNAKTCCLHWEYVHSKVMLTEREIPILSYTQWAVTHNNKYNSGIVSVTEVGSKWIVCI